MLFRQSTPFFTFDERLNQILVSLDQFRILLYGHLEQNLIRNLLGKNIPAVPPAPELPGLQWTYSKIGLVELIYSIKELGVLNHGKADLKTITKCFEYMFNVDLGNISSSFQEILERKKGYANITDKLRDVFLKRINNSLND